MNKQEFLLSLEKEIRGIPSEDVQKSLDFYSEMIDDRVEDGISEEDAVLQIGDVQEIAKEILLDIPITKLVKEKIKPKRKITTLEKVLLAVGSPIWLSLLIAAFAVVFAIYLSLWSVIISVWACEASSCACVLGGILAAVFLFVTGQNVFAGVIMIAASIVFVGVSILLFFVCREASKGMVWLTKKITLWIKSCFLRKEETK